MNGKLPLAVGEEKTWSNDCLFSNIPVHAVGLPVWRVLQVLSVAERYLYLGLRGAEEAPALQVHSHEGDPQGPGVTRQLTYQDLPNYYGNSSEGRNISKVLAWVVFVYAE